MYSHSALYLAVGSHSRQDDHWIHITHISSQCCAVPPQWVPARLWECRSVLSVFVCVCEWMKGWCLFGPGLLTLAPSVFCIFAAGLLSCGTWRNSTWLARQKARRELWGSYQFSSLDVFVFLCLTPSWILCPFFCRSIMFNPDGNCLYSGSENTLRVYGWEPDRCFDVVHVGWGKVSDLAISNNQMVCTSYTIFIFLSTCINQWVQCYWVN